MEPLQKKQVITLSHKVDAVPVVDQLSSKMSVRVPVSPRNERFCGMDAGRYPAREAHRINRRDVLAKQCAPKVEHQKFKSND